MRSQLYHCFNLCLCFFAYIGVFPIIVSQSLYAQELYSVPTGWQKINGSFTKVKAQANTILATGEYSTVVVSNDRGKTWVQADIPEEFSVVQNAIDEQGRLYIVAVKGTKYLLLQQQGNTAVWKEVYSFSSKDSFNQLRYTQGYLMLCFKQKIVLYRNGQLRTQSFAKTLRDAQLLEDGSLIVFYSSGACEGFDSNGKSFALPALPFKLASTSFFYSAALQGAGQTSAQTTILAIADSNIATSSDRGAHWALKGSIAFIPCAAALRTAESAVILADTAMWEVDFHDNMKLRKVEVQGIRNSAIIDVEYRDIAFSDSLHGTVCGTTKTLLQTEDGGQTWAVRSHIGNVRSYEILSFFVNDSVGYAGIHSKALYKTQNAGATWQPLTVPASVFNTESIVSIHFSSERSGCFLNNAPGLLCTNDSAQHFSYLSYIKDGEPGIPSIRSLNDSTFRVSAVSSTPPFTEFYTPLSLEPYTWERTILDSTGLRMTQSGKGDFIAYGHKQTPVGSNAVLYRSVDSARTWKYLPFSQTIDSALAVADFTPIAGTSKAYGIISTATTLSKMLLVDLHGDSAEVLHITELPSVYRVSFEDELHGYAAGLSGSIYETEDGGQHWQDISNNNKVQTSYNQLQNTSRGHFFASAWDFAGATYQSRHILRTRQTVQIITSIEDDSLLYPSHLDIEVAPIWVQKSFPNPFNSKVRIVAFRDLAKSTDAMTLKVYNLFGEEVADLSEEFRRNASSNPVYVDWAPTDILPGIYFIRGSGSGISHTISVIYQR